MTPKEKFDAACKIVDQVIAERKHLKSVLAVAENDLVKNSDKLEPAKRVRDELEPVAKSVVSNMSEIRQAVFAQFCKMPNIWIPPHGVAILSGVNEKTTAAILRDAAKLDGMPVEHNGQRGRGSKYRWLGEKL